MLTNASIAEMGVAFGRWCVFARGRLLGQLDPDGILHWKAKPISPCLGAHEIRQRSRTVAEWAP